MEGSETANVSFDLGAATMEYGNNAPYFQWGRKDPMVPSTGLDNKNKPIFGTYSSFGYFSEANISTGILMPYNIGYSGVGNSPELWNVGKAVINSVDVEPVIKSIYDPSPIGFHIPCSGAFQG